MGERGGFLRILGENEQVSNRHAEGVKGKGFRSVASIR
jgi:hypothetical protein